METTTGRVGRTQRGLSATALVAAVSALLACGGGSGGGAPSSSTGSAPAATITITSSGVNPREVTVSVGATVAFNNNDTVFHEMQSDPHPVHSDCPEIGNVGGLAPGQTKQTAAFTRARACGFHDHGDSTNTRWLGTITVR